MCDDIKQNDFSNVNKAWDNKLIVIYTCTVSVGVSCTLEKFSHCFAFFKPGILACTQSAQMLFRCRKLTDITISYFESRKRKDLPLESKDLFQWVTQSKNLMSLPDEFRHDRNPFITTQTSTSAKALEEALYNKFEGLLWISNEIEKNRSATYFIQRLKTIIERAGMTVHILTQDNITMYEVKQINQSDKEYKNMAEMKRSQLMANNLGRRLTAQELAEEHNVNIDEALGIKKEGDKLGDKARYICKSLNMNGQCLLE